MVDEYTGNKIPGDYYLIHFKHYICPWFMISVIHFIKIHLNNRHIAWHIVVKYRYD